MNLKSGTDVRGVAIAAGEHRITLTAQALNDICAAFLKWLSVKTGKTRLKIAVGHDCRLSAEPIYKEISKVMLACGCDVLNCGLSSTPSMFILLKESRHECDASIMITASHLPFYMNGLKFFTPEGGLSGENIEEILHLAENGEHLPVCAQGAVIRTSFMDEYSAKLVETVRKGTGEKSPLYGHIIIVDASNGCGGFFVRKVLQPLGAITVGSVNLYPNGYFPAHAPNPEAPEAMKALSLATVSAHAEMGIIFDTDVDRAAIVDGNGTPINRDSLIAMVAATLLTGERGTIVTDSVTSDSLTQFIEKRGGKHVRFKRGYKNVIDEAKRREAAGESCPLAMETSGHAAFKENYYLDDGAYLICKLLIAYSRQIKNNRTLTDLIKDLTLPAEEAEIRLRFNENSQNFRQEGERVISEVKHFANIEKFAEPAKKDYEGVRLNFKEGCGDGWTLIRISVHDPVMPINFASRVKGGTRVMAEKLYQTLAKYPFLDATPLKTFIEK